MKQQTTPEQADEAFPERSVSIETAAIGGMLPSPVTVVMRDPPKKDGLGRTVTTTSSYPMSDGEARQLYGELHRLYGPGGPRWHDPSRQPSALPAAIKYAKVYRLICMTCTKPFLGGHAHKCPHCGSISARCSSEPILAVPIPAGADLCLKRVVVARVLDRAGRCISVATNHRANAVYPCPRAGMKTGEGYELCKSVCGQQAHAEVNALASCSFGEARGGTLIIEGHDYACDECLDAARRCYIAKVVVGGREIEL